LAKWWEKGKSLIKGLAIRFCCDRSAARSRKAKDNAGSVSCLAPYHGVLSQLAKLDSEAAKGAQVRSRIRWVEEDETSSAYFFRLEKKKGADCLISALRVEDGSIVSSPEDLCRSFAPFY